LILETRNLKLGDALAFSGVIEFPVLSFHFLSAIPPRLETVLNIEKSILKAMSFALCLAPQTIGHIRPDSFIS